MKQPLNDREGDVTLLRYMNNVTYDVIILKTTIQEQIITSYREMLLSEHALGIPYEAELLAHVKSWAGGSGKHLPKTSRITRAMCPTYGT